MKKGIIIAGFGAIGKTTLGEKYDNIIDLESGYYKWDNTGKENIPYEKRKGKDNRPQNKLWPENYFQEILNTREKYEIVLTSMHWELLEFLEKNDIEYYIAFPNSDSASILEKRCYDRGNNERFTNQLLVNLIEYAEKMKKYNPKSVIYLKKNEFLEDKLKELGFIQ